MPLDGQISSASAAPSASQFAARRAAAPAAIPKGQSVAAEAAPTRSTSPTDVARAGQEMTTNAAAETLVRAVAETKTQKTGVLEMTKEIGARNLAEMKQHGPTVVEQILEQDGAGEPGATVTELAETIAQKNKPGKVDLSQTRPDVTEQLAKQRSITEQNIAAANAEMKANAGPNLAQKMKQQMAEMNAESGAYSTSSLAAVSPQAQGGGAVQMRM